MRLGDNIEKASFTEVAGLFLAEEKTEVSIDRSRQPFLLDRNTLVPSLIRNSILVYNPFMSFLMV